MEGENQLVTLDESMVKVVMTEVMKNFKMLQTKRRRYRPRLCYVCQCPGYLAQSCPSQNDSGRKKIDDNDIRKVMVSSISGYEKCQTDVIKFKNPSESKDVNSIKYAEKSNNEKGSKYDLELINGINDSANNIRYNVKTVTNVERVMSEVIIPMAVNNGITLRRGMNYVKSDDNWNPEQILDVLDQMKKRGFYDCIYLDHTISCDGVEYMIFGNRIDMRLGLKQ
ncbi:6284_t:CDS:2 [Dentiscutata erythropus]|uniref:6284_t:CDS:1 n=1 Tax=Dentiscutata erythropus TaxID=1348616 RepID=A0A9N8ZY59_9GLOM|nr:6284_t:CDS:2 [Dentiscutata erythropus]